MPRSKHPENVSPYTGLRVPVCKGTYMQEGGGLMLQGHTTAIVPCGNPTPKKLPTGGGEWPTFRTARAQRTVRPHSATGFWLFFMQIPTQSARYHPMCDHRPRPIALTPRPPCPTNNFVLKKYGPNGSVCWTRCSLRATILRNSGNTSLGTIHPAHSKYKVMEASN